MGAVFPQYGVQKLTSLSMGLQLIINGRGVLVKYVSEFSTTSNDLWAFGVLQLGSSKNVHIYYFIFCLVWFHQLASQ